MNQLKKRSNKWVVHKWRGECVSLDGTYGGSPKKTRFIS